MEDLEHDIEEAIGKYPDLSDGDVIKVLEDLQKQADEENEKSSKIKRNTCSHLSIVL